MRTPVRGRSAEEAGRPRGGRWAAVVVVSAWTCSALGLSGCGAADPHIGPGTGPGQVPGLSPGDRHLIAAPPHDSGFPAAGLVRRIEQIPPPPVGLELYRPAPHDNRLTAERAELGRRLFFDTRLSRDGTVACASCHRPELGFSDTLRVSPGVYGRTGSRTTPTLLNRVYGRAFFWDGRITTLEEAVLRPIVDPVELDLPLDRLVERLQEDPAYRRAFGEAYPAEGVSPQAIGRALASYVRLLLRGDVPGPEDAGSARHGAGVRGTRGLAGWRANAAGSRDGGSSPREVAEGRALFMGRARCAACHAGPNFTQEEFHNTGVAGFSGDPGRYAVTGREEDRGRFKTPTLRGIRHTRPYMHDGSLATLADVVEFYDGGGGPHPNRTPDLRPLGLTPEEIRRLVAFLESL